MRLKHTQERLLGIAAAVVLFATAIGFPTPPNAGVLPQDANARYELIFWESIKDSNRAEDYEAYLEAYPDGRFAPLAKRRAEYLRKSAKKPAKAPEAPAATAPKPKVAPAPDFRVEEMNVSHEVVNTANLRDGPSDTAKRIATLNRGTRVIVTGRVIDRNWYRIKTASGTSGFIHGALISELTSRKSSSAVAPAQPPPAAVKRESVTKVAPAPTPTTPSPAVALSKTTEFTDCPGCPQMVSLPAGKFVMGDNRGDPNERPAHSVSIRKPFAIGKYEVTLGQWQACVAAGGCKHKPEKAGQDQDRPVRDVSWADAQDYVKWLRNKTGKPYRLPTEAEWEYAARGGTSSRYWWGNSFVKGKSGCKDCGGEYDRKNPSKVGSFDPNPFGLHDVNGGVWEWVSDCWNKSYAGAPSDGSSWDATDCRQRVIRGGSWRNDKTYMHSASRFRYDANVRYLVNGFRVARDMN